MSQYTNRTAVQNYLLVNIDTSFDTQIDEWCIAVSNWIDTYCNRDSFEQEAATSKLYDGNGLDTLYVNDLLSVTKIEILDEDGSVDFTFDSTTMYYLYPANKTPKTSIVINSSNAPIGVFLKGKQNVKITGVFGYATTVPNEIKLVATRLVASIIQEKNLDATAEITSEKLGEYSINFQDIDKLANRLKNIEDILDRYRNIPL